MSQVISFSNGALRCAVSVEPDTKGYAQSMLAGVDEHKEALPKLRSKQQLGESDGAGC